MKTEWKTVTLGEAFVTVTGNTPPKNNDTFYGDFMPLVKPPELRDAPFDFAEDSLSELGAAVARTLPPQSILVSCIGNLGKLGLNRGTVAFNQQINAILPNEDIALPEFMFYQALSDDFKEQLKGLASGTTVPIVNKSKFNSIRVVLPPFSEQKRIVGILDDAFDGIATAKANAEKNLQNARALFESHLRNVITRDSAEWETRSLISLCSLFVDSAHRTPKYQAEGIPALRPRDVVNGKLDLSGAAKVSQEEYEIQSIRHKPSPGDIVYSRELSYGWAVLLPESPRVCLSQGMCLFRPANNVDAKFLLFILNGPIGRAQAESAAVGAAHPHINLGEIKSYTIPLPPITEQRRLTLRFETLLNETQRLESIYQRKLAALDELKKSLLHKAFTGEL